MVGPRFALKARMRTLTAFLGIVVAISFFGETQLRAQDYLGTVEPRPTSAPRIVYKKKKIKKKIEKKVVGKKASVPPRVLPKKIVRPTPTPIPRLKPTPVPVVIQRYVPPSVTPMQIPDLPTGNAAFRHKDLRLGEVKEFGLDAGFHYFEALGDSPNPGFLFTPTVIYQMNPDNSLALEMEYRTQLTPTPGVLTNGWRDLDLTYTYADLYTSPKKTFNISVDLDGMFPTSMESQDASMEFGESVTLKMTQKAGAFKFKFDNTLYGYEYQYDTASNGTDYNSPFAVLDKISVNWTWFKNFEWKNSFGYFTLQDFSGYTHNIYSGSTGFSYNLPHCTLDLVYKYKNGELNDLTILDGDNYQLFTGLTIHL
jgi:hypothetical protein